MRGRGLGWAVWEKWVQQCPFHLSSWWKGACPWVLHCWRGPEGGGAGSIEGEMMGVDGNMAIM